MRIRNHLLVFIDKNHKMKASNKRKQVPDTLIKVGKKGTVYQQKIYRTAERAYGSTYKESEEYEEIIIDRSAAEILDQINQRVKSPYYSLYCGIISLVFVLLCFQVSDILGSLLFLVLAVVTFL